MSQRLFDINDHTNNMLDLTNNELFMQYPDRFIPRYNMVSFTSIPYSEVYRRGNIQKEIISSMNLENPNFNALREMIEDKLTLLN